MVVDDEWSRTGLTLNPTKCAVWAAQMDGAQSQVMATAMRDPHLAAYLPFPHQAPQGGRQYPVPHDDDCYNIAATRQTLLDAQERLQAARGPTRRFVRGCGSGDASDKSASPTASRFAQRVVSCRGRLRQRPPRAPQATPQ